MKDKLLSCYSEDEGSRFFRNMDISVHGVDGSRAAPDEVVMAKFMSAAAAN
jgi:hypothetical protein